MYDEITTLQNNLNRWYDAAVGRWTSEDPIGFLAIDNNLFSYVSSQCPCNVDSSGLFQIQPMVGSLDMGYLDEADGFALGYRFESDNGSLLPIDSIVVQQTSVRKNTFDESGAYLWYDEESVYSEIFWEAFTFTNPNDPASTFVDGATTVVPGNTVGVTSFSGQALVFLSSNPLYATVSGAVARWNRGTGVHAGGSLWTLDEPTWFSQEAARVGGTVNHSVRYFWDSRWGRNDECLWTTPAFPGRHCRYAGGPIRSDLFHQGQNPRS